MDNYERYYLHYEFIMANKWINTNEFSIELRTQVDQPHMIVIINFFLPSALPRIACVKSQDWRVVLTTRKLLKQQVSYFSPFHVIWRAKIRMKQHRKRWVLSVLHDPIAINPSIHSSPDCLGVWSCNRMCLGTFCLVGPVMDVLWMVKTWSMR